MADILPIANLIEAQFSDVREAHIAAETKRDRSWVDYLSTQLTAAERTSESRARAGRSVVETDELVADYKAQLDAAQVALRATQESAEGVDKIAVSVKTVDGAIRSIRLRPAEVVGYLTHLDVKDLELSAPSSRLYDYRILIVFNHEHGVKLTVSSPESRWTSAALFQLDEALRRRVPWWRWVRSGRVLLPLFLLAAEALVVGFLRIVPADSTGPVFSLAVAVSVGALAGVAFSVVRRLIPAFELGDNRVPRGKRAIATVAAWVVSIGLGVVTNLIS